MSAGPLSTGAWKLDGAQEGLCSLKFDPKASVQAGQLGPEDVLVELHAASLNYRDMAIIKVGNPRILCHLAPLTYLPTLTHSLQPLPT